MCKGLKYYEELSTMHKVKPYYDYVWDCDVWELDNDNAVFVYKNDEGKVLSIDYSYMDEEDYWY